MQVLRSWACPALLPCPTLQTRICHLASSTAPIHAGLEPVCQASGGTPTSFHLQQGLGQDAAGHADCLAHVVAGVPTLHFADVELAPRGHREAPHGLEGLTGEKQNLGQNK